MARCGRAVLGAVLTVGLLIAPAVAVADPTPETTTDLGTQAGFARFAVDGAHGHVFVSEPQAGAVAVLDTEGHLLRTIAGLPRAYGMALGGSYLYVAAQTAGEVARIDLNNPTSAQTFVSGLPNPTWLGFAANRLWVGTAPQSTGDSSVISIDPVTGSEQTFGNGSFYGADFATSPSDPDALYMAEAEEEPEPLHRYDLSAFPPRETASNPRYWSGAWGGMALSADGSRLEGAAGGDGAFQELCSQTLQPDGIVYPGTDYSVAVATSATGVLATGLSGYDSPNLAAYRVGVTAPFWTATTPSEDWVDDAGVALSPDGRTLYAAVEGSAAAGPTLLIVTYALPPAPSQPVSDPCPLPAGGSARPGPGGTSSKRSPRVLTGRLRVRLPRHARKPAAGFALTLTLRPRSHGRPGYSYVLKVRSLHCAGGANQLQLTLGRRRMGASCRLRSRTWTGSLAIARTYAVAVRAVRTRPRSAARRGRVFALVLRV